MKRTENALDNDAVYFFHNPVNKRVLFLKFAALSLEIHDLLQLNLIAVFVPYLMHQEDVVLGWNQALLGLFSKSSFA